MSSSAKGKEEGGASLDDLIAELFPAQLKQQSSFDEPSPLRQQPQQTKILKPTEDLPFDEDIGKAATKDSAAKSTTPTSGRNTAATQNQASEFDDSDDDTDELSCKPLNPHVMVPFPDFPTTLVPGATCSGSCTLSCLGNPAVFHPTVESLRHIDQHDVSLLRMTRANVMRMKGAVHATHPEIGNGVHPQKGCPFIVCRRCDHAVVRLQGGRWLDGPDGSRDMYLSVRNFYPDWSRLAHCHGTHAELAAKRSMGPLLAEDPEAVAYACQCSWMTVTVAAFAVTTLAGEVAGGGGDGVKFRTTTVPLESQSDRRPPLWRCRGHIL